MSDSEAELALALPLPDSQSSSSSHDSTTTAPPVTAEQYLRRVRTEASKLPSTFVASSIQSTEVASNATSLVSAHRIVPYPPYLSPVPQSRSTRLICFFCSLQKRVLQAQKQHAFHSTVKIPAVTDVNGLQHLLDQSSQGPLLSIVLRLDFLRVLRLLTIIHSQLQQVPDHYDSKNERHQQVASQLLQSFFAQRRDQWLFALFTLIQPPLPRDIASVLRSILQKAAYARYGVSSSEDHRLAKLNVLATIVAQHFGQHDAS